MCLVFFKRSYPGCQKCQRVLHDVQSSYQVWISCMYDMIYTRKNVALVARSGTTKMVPIDTPYCYVVLYTLSKHVNAAQENIKSTGTNFEPGIPR